ncbi:MAG: response regulator transcription factor [Methylotenera sp.]|nr:response regulator transcription factor [Methylotenera sp.]MDP1753978.1 response regulator transcription factor [Methylotenera sp.]MDP1960345.1 response regulator transcription factor [Methylotenera sp.]MDP2101365.1 response regulator transcription factor [Methylotenera sp.]MDP2281644.1 response regulator transcription factor [Methylotenera sp.]
MRLLLVEDDIALGSQLHHVLKKAGYAVDLSTDGVDAEAVGDLEPYDLIVLDLGLPKRPGLEVLSNWRKRGNQVPVVILTARGSWQEKVEGFKAGADDYVGKPFQINELLARINAVLKRSAGSIAGTLKVENITLDEDKQELILQNDQRQNLTATEFRLLRYFMLHPGQLLSKSKLTEHVYEYDEDKDSNVIEVYVNRLRKIIGPEMIKTRRGQGYVFGNSD